MKSTVQSSQNSIFFGSLLALIVIFVIGVGVSKADETKSQGRKAAVQLVKNSGLEKLLAALKAEQACNPESSMEALKLDDETAWACLGLETESTKTQFALK